MTNPITRIDESYPLDPLLMVAPATSLQALKQDPACLPAGYAWIEPEEIFSFRHEWAALLMELSFVSSEDKALSIFDSMYQDDPDYFIHHLYAIKSLKDNHLACSVGLWYGSAFPNHKRIHWMMTSPYDQQQGLARATLKKAMSSLAKEEPNQDLYLSTQAASWPAIVLYESLGFQPYLEDCLKASAIENQARWKVAQEIVLARQGITI